MIKKPEGYDQAQAYTGEFASLPAGCYVCVIKQVSQTETQNHRPQLAVLFDIAEGDQKGFFQRQYDNARKTGTDVKWKGVHKQIMDGSRAKRKRRRRKRPRYCWRLRRCCVSGKPGTRRWFPCGGP